MLADFNLFNQIQAAPEGAALPSLNAYRVGEAIKSPEDIRRDWLMHRRGKFTASEFHRLMAYQNKNINELPPGAKTYAMEKAIELLTDWKPDTYCSPEMQWEIDHESQAMEEFIKATGHKVYAHGKNQIFLQLGPDIGGTPDGIIPTLRSGVEIKCPSSKKHIDYLSIIDESSLKRISPDYYWQCQGLMEINNSDYWHFVSYDPRFKNPKLRFHVSTINRVDSDIQDLRVRLDMAVEYRNGIMGVYF